MNPDFKILIRKSLIFLFPVLLWIMIVIIVDPFNYFNYSHKISEQSKLKSAQRLNSLLFNSIKFKNNPTPNIIIGDSRIRKLPNDRIEELTGNEYFTLHSNAAKLNEIVDLFWLANEYSNLENVILGVNFNLYNEYAYSNRVADVKELLSNQFIYIFNWNILETVYLALKNEFFGIQKNQKRDRDKFWEHTINTVAENHYGKWKKPENSLNKLKEIGVYCKENNINLTLLIVPHYKEFHDRLVDFNLAYEESKFKEDIKKIGKVVDYDFPNVITECKSCFGDPIHTTDSVSTVIINDLFSDSLTIGKELH